MRWRSLWLSMGLLGSQPQDDCLPVPATDPSPTTPPPSATSTASAPVSSSSVPPKEPAGTFTVATVNAGLARGWIKHADLRRPAIHEALSREPLDVLCVQELWATADYVALLRATASTLAEQHRVATRRPRGACSHEILAALERCAQDECSNRDEALVSCVTERCKQSASGASRECVQCLAGHTLAGEELVGCATGRDAPARLVLPRGGVALFSAWPIVERDTLDLASPLLDRLVLHARMSDTPIGTVDVFCTHLTTPLPVDLPGMSPDINRHQVESLLAFVKSKRPPGVTLVLGDFNNGPAIGEAIRGHYPAHYELLVDAGFDNPYVSSGGVACTRCDDNPLVGGTGKGGLLIDHVLVKGHRGAARATRFLDVPTVKVGDLLMPPSDHYGIRVTLAPGRR